jgi:acyl carrier protein
MEERLRTLIAEILDIAPDEIQPQMRRADTASWDSLSHLRLITAFEDRFGIALTMDEIERIQTPAELQAALDQRRGGNAPGAD